MVKKLLKNLSQNESQELRNLKNNIGLTKKFLNLVRHFDQLPKMEKTPYDATRSLYQAVSKGRDISRLVKVLEIFYGPPRKAPGKSMPLSLRFNPSIKYLRGIREEQYLFLKEAKEGFFYAALWPWQKTAGNITVHLGYISSKMSKNDYTDLEKLVKTNVLNEKVFKAFDADNKSRIYGISLASFLKMAAFEKISCNLEIKTRSKAGRLFLRKGELIAAETGRLKSKSAAYEILSWENTSVELKEVDGKKKNEINQGLLEILVEALKLRSTGSGERRTIGRAGRTSGEKPSDEKYRKLLGSAKVRDMKRFLPVFVTVLGVIFVVGAISFVYTRVLIPRQIQGEYDALLELVERSDSLEEKEIILQEFINSNPEYGDTEKVENKIKEIRDAIEKQDFQIALNEVNNLTIDSDYEVIARDIYSGYLIKYPNGVYEDKIKEKIAEIPSLIDEIDYKKLTEVAQSDFGKRIDAYLYYLSKHPQGKYIRVVEELIEETGEEYYNYLIREITFVEQHKLWDRGIELCNRFIDIFKNSYHLNEVIELKASLQSNKDYDLLMAHIKRSGSNYWRVRKAYYDFLAKHPNTDKKDAIEKDLSRIAKIINELKKWERVLVYSKNEKNQLAKRIYELENYINYNPSGPYVDPAKKILRRLQTENQTIKQKQIGQQRSREQARIRQEKNRINNERKKIKTMLSQSGKRRYVSNNNGTFTDKKTGLTWCLLDSKAALNTCLDYKSAQKYVKSLKTGGFRDWRLPYSNELAAIYKSEPFFPDNRAKWYWTSEVFIKGYSKTALIVTSKHEKAYKRQQANLNKCGWVRAVRP
ncbi:MAG: DUF1566 domain-containing protein [Deltaproteobacteria bacterium]|nr:DUF1566 domain-containing protein [Deltaproteobacteria bacterium]